jgi:uncharacterized protein (TIGR03435 family)
LEALMRSFSPPRLAALLVALLLPVALIRVIAQDSISKPAPPEFDVVSIKPNTSGTLGGSARTLPDGSDVLINQPIRSLILAASPVQTREVVGLPDWVTSERYDITLKPPPGTTSTQHRQMMQDMFADRMKLVAHVEQRERDVYSMVLAHADGRLGPELKKSSLDCGPRPPGSPPPPPPSGPPSEKDFASRCGMMMGRGVLVSGGMPMNNLAVSLYGFAGGEVTNDTGLEGFYALTLKFSPQSNPVAPPDPVSPTALLDDAPDIFTALEEQLGLKLRHGKKTMPVFVVDHIERPSEN